MALIQTAEQAEMFGHRMREAFWDDFGKFGEYDYVEPEQTDAEIIEELRYELIEMDILYERLMD